MRRFHDLKSHAYDLEDTDSIWQYHRALIHFPINLDVHLQMVKF